MFVGTTALGTREVVATPLDTLFVGVEVQATVADNLLQQDFIRRSQFGTVLEGLVVLVLGVAVTCSWRRPARCPACSARPQHGGVWYVAGWLLSTTGVFVSPLMPTIGVVRALAIMTLVKFTVERGRAESAGTRARRMRSG